MRREASLLMITMMMMRGAWKELGKIENGEIFFLVYLNMMISMHADEINHTFNMHAISILLHWQIGHNNITL